MLVVGLFDGAAEDRNKGALFTASLKSSGSFLSANPRAFVTTR